MATILTWVWATSLLALGFVSWIKYRRAIAPEKKVPGAVVRTFVVYDQQVPRQNLSYVEVSLETDRAKEKSLGEAINKMALHLDDKYYGFGTNGLRIANGKKDMIIGVEVRTVGDKDRAIIRMVPRDPNEDPILIISLQEYTHSDEFKEWTQAIEVE